MTPKTALLKVVNRCRVDLSSEVDTSNNELMTAELMSAAKEVSRDTYFLFTDHSALTLSACTTGASAGAVLDMLNTNTSEKAIFHVYGIFINAGWLEEIEWSKFMANNPSYWTETANSNPASYALMAPSKARISPPHNATAATAGGFAIGFYLHDEYAYQTHQDTELLGPSEFHDLIVNKCALNISEAYLQGDSALVRWNNLKGHYDTKAAEYKAFNLSVYKKQAPQGNLGSVRRITSLA